MPFPCCCGGVEANYCANYCSSGTSPYQIDVTIASAADGSCSTCDENFNGTFRCTQVSQCTWYYDMGTICGLGHDLTVMIVDYGGGLGVQIRVEIYSSDLNFRAGWRLTNVSTPYNCQFSSLSLNLWYDDPIFNLCDWSSSTCSISAV